MSQHTLLSRYIQVIGFFMLLCAFFQSCGSAEKSVKRGDAALALGEYAEAAGQYKKAYSQTSPKDKPARGRIAYKMGDAYRRYGNIARAAGAFQNAVRYHYTDTLTYLVLGHMLRQQGNYKSAEEAYRKYLEKDPNNEEADRGIDYCLTAPVEKQKESAYTVKMAPLFNGSRSDYSPAYMGIEAQQLYFSSTRAQSKGDVSGITAMKMVTCISPKRTNVVSGKWWNLSKET